MTPELNAFLLSDVLDREIAFANNLAKRKDIDIQYELNNSSFTDGKNIVIDPTTNNAYLLEYTFNKAKNYFNYPPKLNYDPFLTLFLVSRGINVHETLHIMFSNFPLQCDHKDLTEDAIHLLHFISNIIEDAFIEQVASTEFEGLKESLIFTRIMLSSTKDIEFEYAKWDKQRSLSPFEMYLSYMTEEFLYPFYDTGALPYQEELLRIYKKTQPLFQKAVVEVDPNKRDSLAYEITLELIDYFEDITFDNHDIVNLINPIDYQKKSNNLGRISRPNDNYELKGEHLTALAVYIQLVGKPFNDFSSPLSTTHGHIKCVEERDFDLDVYQEEFQQMRGKVHEKYKDLFKKFEEVLTDEAAYLESKQNLGSKIDSKRLYDPKRRYGIKNNYDTTRRDVSIFFLVDSSVSMLFFMDQIIETLVLMHEILEEAKIPHAVMMFSAGYHRDVVFHDFFFDYNEPSENFSRVFYYLAEDCSRDGYSLRVAQNHILENGKADNMYLFLISNGIPNHFDAKKLYTLPSCYDDMMQAQHDIKYDKINLVPFAYRDSYEQLKRIYENPIRSESMDELIKNLAKEILRTLSSE